MRGAADLSLGALVAEAIGTFALVFAGAGLTAPLVGAALGAFAYQFVRGEVV